MQIQRPIELFMLIEMLFTYLFVCHLHRFFSLELLHQICQHWLRQCFWNYLDWEEICLYICTCLTMGIDYQVC